MLQPRVIALQFDEATVRAAARIYIWRRAVVGQKLLWAVALAEAVLLIWVLYRDEPRWLAWMIGGAILLPALVALMGWWVLLRQKLAQLRAMPTRRAELHLGMNGIEIRSGDSRAVIHWTDITEYWRLPGFWMIFLAPNHYVTIPHAGVSQEDLQALSAGMAGAKAG